MAAHFGKNEQLKFNLSFKNEESQKEVQTEEGENKLHTSETDKEEVAKNSSVDFNQRIIEDNRKLYAKYPAVLDYFENKETIEQSIRANYYPEIYTTALDAKKEAEAINDRYPEYKGGLAHMVEKKDVRNGAAEGDKLYICHIRTPHELYLWFKKKENGGKDPDPLDDMIELATK